MPLCCRILFLTTATKSSPKQFPGRAVKSGLLGMTREEGVWRENDQIVMCLNYCFGRK